MRVNWAESWQVASEIVEMLEIDMPIQDQERIAKLIHGKDGELWHEHHQEWRPYKWPKVEQAAKTIEVYIDKNGNEAVKVSKGD